MFLKQQLVQTLVQRKSETQHIDQSINKSEKYKAKNIKKHDKVLNTVQEFDIVFRDIRNLVEFALQIIKLVPRFRFQTTKIFVIV